MENQNFMVSEEIADEVDKSQFEDKEIEESIDEKLIVKLISEDNLVPGILEKITVKTGPDEEYLFSFMTHQKNVKIFKQNLGKFKNVKMSMGVEDVCEYDIDGLSVKKFSIDQKATAAGCVITVVYK